MKFLEEKIREYESYSEIKEDAEEESEYESEYEQNIIVQVYCYEMKCAMRMCYEMINVKNK